jgi:FkbM family methyltransferase
MRIFMDTPLIVNKLSTAIDLAIKGELLRTVKQGGTEWQREKRKKTWEKRIITRKPILERLSSGGIIELYPGDRLSELIYKREFESGEQEFTRQFLRAGDIFVDIGANLGLYTIIAAKVVGKQGKVFAFEPAILNYKRLLKNVSLNQLSNVNCVQAAVSNRKEQGRLKVFHGGYNAHNSLAHQPFRDDFEVENVQCIAWDEYACENNLQGKVTLMKIDVEGWELYVLDGAEKTFSQSDSPDLLVEFTDENAQSAGSSCNMLYRKLEELGYKMYQIDAERHVLIPEELRKSYPYINLLATKRIEFVLKRSKFILG